MQDIFKSVGINTVFCDSVHALKYANNHGLLGNATILTVSPALIDEKENFPNFNIENISDVWSRDKLFRYQRTIKDFAFDIYDCCVKDDILFEYALVLSREAVNSSRLIYKAGLLKDDDIMESRGMISVETGADPRLEKINPPYEKLLNSNDSFINIHVPFEPPENYGLKVPSLVKRLRRAGIESIVYRLGMLLLNKVSFFWKKGINIYVLRENELLIETASVLIKKGYSVQNLKSCSASFEVVKHIEDKLKILLYPAIHSRVKDWVCKSVVDACVEEVVNNMLKSISRQVGATTYWEKNSFVKSPNSIVLNGYSGKPEDIALYNVLNKYGNKMCTFQHGVTPELSYILDEEAPFCETSCSNIFFSYNSKIKKYYESLPFSVGKIKPVGMPKRFYKKKSSNIVKDDILFVSMNLYRGNINFLTGFLTDYGRFTFERDMVVRILSRINKIVVYKPYPETNIRYTEPDPVLKYVNQSSNIRLESSYVDLRYIVGNYKAVIVSGASSTISWIIMSDIPLIFINNDDKLTLRDEFKSDFIDSVIYFDIAENGSYDRIHSYLNQPIKNIEDDWESKRVARKKLISTWFTSKNSIAGELASNIITN
jgi:hypothetical protein